MNYKDITYVELPREYVIDFIMITIVIYYE